MKKKFVIFLLALSLTMGLGTGCGNNNKEALSAEGEASGETEKHSDSGAEASGDMSQVADASEMTEVEEVTDDGMTPVGAEAINPGTYEVAVRSSSSMFKIDSAELSVGESGMEATLHMHSDAYSHVYVGTGAEAAADDEYIKLIPEGDAGSFTFPIEAVDQGIPVAAFSVRKQKWYDRTLLFEAASLPAEAFKEGQYETVADLGISDGTYQCEVTLSGGSGKASVKSPCTLVVEDGGLTATIEWSSDKYDYMMVDGERYDPINDEGNSVFEIPIPGFSHPVAVQADTTAMSKPYLIDYTLSFDGASLK